MAWPARNEKIAEKDGYEARLISTNGYIPSVHILRLNVDNASGEPPISKIPLAKDSELRRFAERFSKGFTIDTSLDPATADQQARNSSYLVFADVMKGRKLSDRQWEFLQQENPLLRRSTRRPILHSPQNSTPTNG